jgi:hypothetical protein
MSVPGRRRGAPLLSPMLAHNLGGVLPPTAHNQYFGSHPPSEQTHPQNSRYTPRCPSVVLWTPCSGVEWACVLGSHQGLERTRKQPANLAVEGAENSLSILPDYTPTVRPPPKRC